MHVKCFGNSRVKRMVSTLHQLFILVSIGAVVAGCRLLADPVENFAEQHDVLRKKDAYLIEGPYRMGEVVAPNRISIWSDGREIEVRIRGSVPTGDEELDFRAEKLLGTMWPDGLFVRTDCKMTVGTNGFSAVVYDAANGKETLDEKGDIEVEILTYRMPQLLNLVYGYCVLDHSDTNYPLYQVFLEAERLAKKHKKGYWATHTEPPAQATTNTVSSVPTNK